MHIKEILSQHRRDFKAVLECEHCLSTQRQACYDDDNFHINVIPIIPCDDCGKVAGPDYVPRETKYAAWVQV